MKDTLRVGFEYTIEVVDKNGVVTDSETVHNLMPTQGMDHLLGVLLLGNSPTTQWYVGVYENPYSPVASDNAATFPALAGESVAYAGTTRLAFTPGTVNLGTIDNSLNPAEFEATEETVFYGGFISSSAARGSTSGILLSAVRFSTPKSVDPTSTLRVTAGFSLVSM